MEQNVQELLSIRKKRIDDALNLCIPDKVPLEIAFGYFPAKYAGVPYEAAYYDYEKWLFACKKTLMDFDVDVASVQPFFPGSVLESLGPKTIRWPGYGASNSHQYIEGEFMKEDEYSFLLKDHTDFLLRRYLPRIFEAMEGFSKFPSLSKPLYGYHAGIVFAEAFCSEELLSSIEKLRRIGEELAKWRPKLEAFEKEIRSLGFPPFVGGFALAPFDAISDHLRGMRGSMIDMYRRPDELIEACNMILQRTLENIPPASENGVNTIAIPLHRGSEGFMSLKQFERFYWPGLKGLILGLIEKGITPLVFFEGDYTSRLEYLLELPKGKIFAHLDETDIFKAKDIIGGHLCFSGNVPCSLLATSNPEDVKQYCKKMLNYCAKDGGFIMSTRSPVDDVKPENLKAMIEVTRAYGS